MALQRLALALVVTSLLVWNLLPVLGAWQTLSGKAPIVVADGGTSGLYPDQTLVAYLDALNTSVSGVVITCDLQISGLAVSGGTIPTGICRKGLNLANSTNIGHTSANLNKTYVVDGVPTNGWFAIDFTFQYLHANASATQSVLSRSPAFDTLFPILKPEYISPLGGQGTILSGTPTSTWWLNAEYTRFTEANSNFNATQTLIEIVQQLKPGYVSVPEINLLKQIQSSPNTTTTKLIYKFLDLPATADLSTNQTYDSLKQNLSFIRTFASGILVPKSYILPIGSDLYVQAPTTLVQDAHNANLEVYGYTFANDLNPNSYNYSYDPVTELLFFMDTYNFSVDGVFTGFPTTASEAISCYASDSGNGSAQIKESGGQKPVIISHNGDSGRFPGATEVAYASAIAAGVDYIDCIVQITKDSIPICQATPNLIDTTNIINTAFWPTYTETFQGFNGGNPGIFTLNLTLSNIQTLKCIAYSGVPGFSRDPGYNNQYGILTLAQFLKIAKDNKVGALIDIQNAVYLLNVQNLAVVDAVVEVLSAAGYDSSDKVIMQSDDSSALKRLRILNITYPLMYEVIYDPTNPFSLDASDFAQIKEFATHVNLDKLLLEPYDANYFIQGPPSNLTQLAHDQNLTVFFQVQKNEPTTYAFDLKADPTLQLTSLAHYGVDGFITDYPRTVKNFEENQCSVSGVASSVGTNFSIPLVIPGVLSAQYTNSNGSAPAPNLQIPEAPLGGIQLPAPAPAPGTNAGTRPSLCFVMPGVIVIIQLLAVL